MTPSPSLPSACPVTPAVKYPCFPNFILRDDIHISRFVACGNRCMYWKGWCINIPGSPSDLNTGNRTEITTGCPLCCPNKRGQRLCELKPKVV